MRRDPNTPFPLNVSPKTITDLPAVIQKRLLNDEGLSVVDRSRLAIAHRDFETLERLNRARYKSASRQISRNLKTIPFSVECPVIF